MEPGWTCSLCHLESADSFCCCGNSETFLCKNCLVAHHSKFPKRIHQNLPLATYGHHRTPGYFERLNARMKAVEAGKEALLQQLQLTDRCLEEINAKINELYRSIWEAGQKACEAVKREQTALQEKVQRSTEEAERTVYEDNPALSEAYTTALRAFTGEFPFSLFEYEVKVCETVDSILKVTFKSPIYAPQTTIPDLSEGYTCPKFPGNPDENPLPQTSKERKAGQQRIGSNTTLWTCSCEYAYNLITDEKCTKCSLSNPFLPVKPPPTKCVKCGIRDITQPGNTCRDLLSFQTCQQGFISKLVLDLRTMRLHVQSDKRKMLEMQANSGRGVPRAEKGSY